MRRVVFLCAFLCLVTPVHAQEAMTAAALQQHMLQAQGKPPEQYREETITSTTGLGVYLRREFHRGDDYRVVYGTGSFQHQTGRLGGKDWDQDANGVTTIQAPLGAGRPIPQTVTVALVSQPFKAWRLASLDAGGYGTVQYVDPQTYLVVREEDVTPGGRIVKSYGNFRTADGYTMPYRISTDDGTNGTHSDADVITFGAREVSDADLAIPVSKNPVSFPPDRTSVTVPATFDVPRVDVHVTIGGRQLEFLLETGAPDVTLDPNVARALGLVAGVQNARANTSQTVVPEIRIGDLTMKNVVVSLAPVTSVEAIDTHVAGILGYDFMRGAGITIDYPKKRVTAVPPDHFPAPVMTPNSDILPLTVLDHAPAITARINGALSSRVIIDSGGPADLVVFASFLLRYPEITVSRIARPEDPVLYSGVTLPDVKGYRFAELLVGRLTFQVIDVAVIPSLEAYRPGVDAVLGYGLFDEFALGFDYAGGRLYVVNRQGK